MYHIVLAANAEWGASIPNASGRTVTIESARGMVCWNLEGLGRQGCNGPGGNESGAGGLIQRNRGGRTWFSADDRTKAFRDNEGYFEFDARVR